MCLTLKQWLDLPETKAIHDEMKNCNGKMLSTTFHRDPFRSTTYNPSLMYSPADGIVLYALDRVDPDDFLDIKGRQFTLKQLLNDKDYNTPSLVIAIFMSALDVHVNRMPCNAIVTDVRDTPNIFTRNSSMLNIENSLLEDHKYHDDDLAYLFSNEKKVTVCYSPVIKSRFYLVQIADKDINVIVNWSKHKYFTQSERFGSIRYGSQVEMVIPLDTKNTYEILVKKLWHVEGGLDPLVQVYK